MEERVSKIRLNINKMMPSAYDNRESNIVADVFLYIESTYKQTDSQRLDSVPGSITRRELIAFFCDLGVELST